MSVRIEAYVPAKFTTIATREEMEYIRKEFLKYCQLAKSNMRWILPSSMAMEHLPRHSAYLSDPHKTCGVVEFDFYRYQYWTG
jgi:hypothetical protein